MTLRNLMLSEGGGVYVGELRHLQCANLAVHERNYKTLSYQHLFHKAASWKNRRSRMQNGQPLPDEQSDGFKSCSRWKLQRLPGMPAASLIQTQASVAGRSSLTCTYSRTSTSATILQNRVQAVPPGSQANCMRTDILVEKLYRRTVNTHNNDGLYRECWVTARAWR